MAKTSMKGSPPLDAAEDRELAALGAGHGRTREEHHQRQGEHRGDTPEEADADVRAAYQNEQDHRAGRRQRRIKQQEPAEVVSTDVDTVVLAERRHENSDRGNTRRIVTLRRSG